MQRTKAERLPLAMVADHQVGVPVCIDDICQPRAGSSERRAAEQYVVRPRSRRCTERRGALLARCGGVTADPVRVLERVASVAGPFRPSCPEGSSLKL